MDYPLLNSSASALGPRGVLESPLPWYQADLLLKLKRLFVTILVSMDDLDPDWSPVLSEQLRTLVIALRNGRHLKSFHLCVKQTNPFKDRQMAHSTFDNLRGMRIGGELSVNYLDMGIGEDPRDLERYLVKIMKA